MDDKEHRCINQRAEIFVFLLLKNQIQVKTDINRAPNIEQWYMYTKVQQEHLDVKSIVNYVWNDIEAVHLVLVVQYQNHLDVL